MASLFHAISCTVNFFRPPYFPAAEGDDIGHEMSNLSAGHALPRIEPVSAILGRQLDSVKTVDTLPTLIMQCLAFKFLISHRLFLLLCSLWQTLFRLPF